MTGVDLRVGIVGTGWGAIAHAPAYAAATGYTPIAMCGRNEPRLERAARQSGLTDTSTDWKAFVRRNDLDVISIATAVESHIAIAHEAVEAGKHIVVEKPLSLDPLQSWDLASRVQKASVVGAVCFEQRWLPERFAVWDLVRSGRLGEIYTIRISHSLGYWHPTHAPQARWMYLSAEGGGYLRGTLSHDLDFVRVLAGDFAAVSSDVVTSIPTRRLNDGSVVHVDADDTTSIVGRATSGTSVLISISVMGAHADYAAIEVFGSSGTAVIKREASDVRVMYGAADSSDGLTPLTSPLPPLVGEASIPTRRAAIYARAMAHMLEELRPRFRGETSRAPTIEDGAAADEVIDAVRRASRERCWVDLLPADTLSAQR